MFVSFYSLPMQKIHSKFARAFGAVILAFSSTVSVACSVTADNLNFGQYDPFGSVDIDSASNFTVSCSSRVNFTVSLSTGQSGNYSSRIMTSGANQLNYNLYTKANRRTVWGDGTGGSETKSWRAKNTTETIYATTPAGQSLLPTGTYTDTITVTVDF